MFKYMIFMGRIKDDETVTPVKRPKSNDGDTKTITKKTVWSTKRVDEWMRDYSEGIAHKDNPWLDGTIGVRNPDIVFEYTEEEIRELTKCANDIFYFANNYAWCLQGSKGYQPLTLRDYQNEMLESYVNNRFSICLTSRQVGKCSIVNKINLCQNKNNFHKYIEDVYYENKNGILSHIKHFLIKIYRKL